jgi:hypothetical protein
MMLPMLKDQSGEKSSFIRNCYLILLGFSTLRIEGFPAGDRTDAGGNLMVIILQLGKGIIVL